MTGYGRATAIDTGSGASWTVEIRAVNHRGLDVKVRGAEGDGYCDLEVTRLVRAALERGAVTVNLRAESTVRESSGIARLRRAHAALEALRRELDLPGPVDLATVSTFLALEGRPASSLEGPELWLVLRPAVEEALAALLHMRQREGRSLAADMVGRLAQLRAIVVTVGRALEPLPERYARRLSEKLALLRDLPGYEAGRVAQEVALLADRLDVSEELARLDAHLGHLGALFDSEPGVGRKLDFVIQEIGREINTLGAKSQDAEVAAQVILAKSELEKLREQAQNIE